MRHTSFRLTRIIAIFAIFTIALPHFSLVTLPAAVAADSYTVSSTIPVGDTPLGVAVNANTNRVYVVNSDTSSSGNSQGSVSVIDGATNSIVATIPVKTAPVGIAVNPVTNTIYVANSNIYANHSSGYDNTISVIDGNNNTVTATIQMFDFPLAVTVDSVTNLIYVTNRYYLDQGNVTVIDGNTNSVVKRISLDHTPFGIAANPVTNKVYVAVTDSLLVIDGFTNTVVDTIDIEPSTQWAVAVDPLTNLIYITHAIESSVTVVDGSTDRVIFEAISLGIDFFFNNPVGAAANGAVIDLATHSLYLTFGRLYVLDTRTFTIKASLPTGSLPLGVAVNPSTGTIYVSNYGSNTVSVVASTAQLPTISSLIPNRGVTIGGTSVTITGSGFTGATAIWFGGTAATSVIVDSDTKIEAVSPAHASGTVDVTVTTPGGTSQTSSADQFAFIEQMRLPVQPYYQVPTASSPWATDAYGSPSYDFASGPSDDCAHLGAAPAADGTKDPPGADIWHCGCFMTDWAMVVNFYLGQVSNGTMSITPRDLNGWLRETSQGYVNGLYTNQTLIPSYFEHLLENTKYSLQGMIGQPQSHSADTDLLKSLLDAGTPVILQVDGGNHWVLATGYSIDASNNVTWYINDPNDSDNTTLAAYGNSFTTMWWATLVHDTVDDVGSIYSNLASPADLLVTDALGRRSGFDPETNTMYNEIPNAIYYRDSTIPPGASDPGHIAKIFDAWAPLSATYTIKIFGTGTGTFHFSTTTSDSIGNFTSTTFVESTQPGIIDKFTLTYDSQSGATSTLVQDDTEPPTTTASVVPTPNSAGWNNTDTTVTLSSIDNPNPDGSGVNAITYSTTGAQPAASTDVFGDSASVVVSAEGTTTIEYFATDNAGNSEEPQAVTVNIDKTAPTLSYAGNLGTYTVDQSVSIICSASDALSQVASTTCKDITGPAYSFALGSNASSATATDNAGNVGQGSVQFTVGVTADSLCSLTKQFVRSPQAGALICVPLVGLRFAAVMHNQRMKSAYINFYILLIRVLGRSTLTNQQAATLIQLARSL